MNDEDLELRPQPRQPYQLGASCVVVPILALEGTLGLLRRAGRLESAVFWYGTKDAAGNATVSYVVAPQQLSRPRNYHVPAASVGDMVRRLKPGWKPIAQIHSHPGDAVEHSNYDDRMAISTRALSLVVPRYGHWSGTFPERIGVHEWQNNYWYLLTMAHARSRIRLVNGEVVVEDLR
ncbi:MAG TPA: hypothetical protein VN039_13220 [Nitrospira sp.]|nr:hypothetical protein [Nitrospira sp.]